MKEDSHANHIDPINEVFISFEKKPNLYQTRNRHEMEVILLLLIPAAYFYPESCSNVIVFQ
jgi:hypothetical protein